jgi:hypothetical protein
VCVPPNKNASSVWTSKNHLEPGAHCLINGKKTFQAKSASNARVLAIFTFGMTLVGVIVSAKVHDIWEFVLDYILKLAVFQFVYMFLWL